MASIEKTKNTTPSITDSSANSIMVRKFVYGTVLATTAYSVYKIGSLPDKIPHERAYVITGIVGGAVVGFLGMAQWSPNEKQETMGMVGLSTLVTTLGYSISRGVFKQSPKNSLIAGLVLLGGAYIWHKSNQTAPVVRGGDARPIQAQPITNQSVGGGEETPIQTVKNMTGTGGFFTTEKQKVNY